MERTVRISAIEKYGITIRRLKCVVCGKIHRELPDFLFPYKHYPMACIEEEVERGKRAENLRKREAVICAYPELSTCSRWRKEFGQRQVVLNGMQEEDERFFSCKNLQKEKGKTGIGWLADWVRTAVNAGFSVCTEFAFSKAAFPAIMKEVKVYAGDVRRCMFKEYRNGGWKNMKENEDSIVKWLLLEIRRVHFQDSTAFMATALGFSQKMLQGALASAGGQRIVEVFEEAMRYCVRNHIGLDDMLMRYPGTEQQD